MKEDGPPFTCCSCGKVLPFKRAWMLTRYSEIQCDHCGQALVPIPETVPRIHAFSGLVGSFVGIALHQKMGWLAAPPVIATVLLFNCLVGTKTVHFRAQD